MMQYESVEMTSHKEFFTSTWKPQYVAFVIEWIRRCVATQHKAILGGCHLVLGFILLTLQLVTLENVHVHMGPDVSDAQLPLKIHQNAVKNAFVLQLSNYDKDKGKRQHPINAYYDKQMEEHEVKDEHGQVTTDPGFPHLHAHRDSDKQTHLNQTSLQDAARRYTANWRVSTYSNLWPRTKYWTRLEWERIVARNPMLSAGDGNRIRRKAVEAWLFGHLLGEQHLQEFAESSRDQLQEMLVDHLQKTPEIEDHIAEHSDLWLQLWCDMDLHIVRFLHGSLIPVEWANSAVGTGQRDDGQEEKEGEKKKKNDNGFLAVDALAVRRCIWSFAIQKRVEEIERLTRIETDRPLFELKRWALFPLPGFVPGHILCGNGLFDHLARDWNAQFKPPPPPPKSRKRKNVMKTTRRRRRRMNQSNLDPLTRISSLRGAT